MEGDLPPGCEAVEVATYVCPFAPDYVGCVMLIKSRDGIPAPFVVLQNAIHGTTLDYQNHSYSDNLFIALMEFATSKVDIEIAVNSCAMRDKMRVSQWN
jgi:hypothetical protein